MKVKVLSALILSCAAALFGAQQAKAEHQVTVDTLAHLVAAFNAHDLDAVMSFFADDCELMMPRGPGPWGQRYVGKADVRKGLATRFQGIPDVHYGDVHNWVSGSHGVSQWTLTGTTRDGKKIKVRGCDLLEFRDGKIIRKDSYWKIVEPTTQCFFSRQLALLLSIPSRTIECLLSDNRPLTAECQLPGRSATVNLYQNFLG